MNENEINNIIENENGKYNLKRESGYENSDQLVPQFYWGNIEKPRIVILGKNPSYSIDDELDNKYLRKYLKDNLDYDNRDDKVVKLLTNTDCDFSLSGTSRWWRKAFDGWKLFEECPDKNSFMKNVVIFNMFGFYSPSLNEKPSKESYIDDNKKNKIIELLNDCEEIYIMWKASIDWWFGENGLLKIEISEDMKKKLYIVNSKCSCNSKFKEAETYSEYMKRKNTK